MTKMSYVKRSMITAVCIALCVVLPLSLIHISSGYQRRGAGCRAAEAARGGNSRSDREV